MAKRKAKRATLRDERGNLLGVVDPQEMEVLFRLIKHDKPDGIYSINGPGTDCVVERKDGFIYLTAGTYNGEQVTPRSIAEAEEFFREEREGLEREQAERRRRRYAVIGSTDCAYAVDLRTFPAEGIQHCRERFKSSGDRPIIQLPKRFFTWEEARLVALRFNVAVLRRPCPTAGEEADWRLYLDCFVREMIVALENAEGPDDPEYRDAIEEYGPT